MASRTSHTCAITDVGRVRENNEDSFLADDQRGIYAVADGVGGHRAGEVASRVAVEAAQAAAAQALAARSHPCTPEELLAVAWRAVERACTAVHELARPDGAHAGASTTLTLLLLDGNRAALAHVGDSRLYLVRGPRVEQISIDHTVPNDLLRAGYITPQEASRHPFRNVLTRALGSQPSVIVDTTLIHLHPGDVLLLASDGLNAAVDDTALVHDAARDPDLAAGAERLIARANELGGRDNSTAVLIRIDETTASARARAVELLEGLPLFAGLELSGRSRVVGMGSFVELEAGTPIVERGSTVDGLWLVVDGRVDWEQGGQSQVLQPGAWFGEVAMLGPRSCQATVVAREPVRLFHLPSANLAQLASHRPVLGVAILRKLVATLSRGRAVAPHVPQAVRAASQGGAP